jgi:hypothetical protein
MAKIPKMTLATRNPVFCELTRGFLRSRCDLSAKNSDTRSAFHPRHDVVIHVYEDTANLIETHEHAGEFKEW